MAEEAKLYIRRSRKTGKKRYVIKVGNRQIGKPYGDRMSAREALRRYNERMRHQRTKAQIAQDRERILDALQDGSLTFPELLEAVFPDTPYPEHFQERQVQSDLKALRKSGHVVATRERRRIPQKGYAASMFGGAGTRTEHYNVYSLASKDRSPNPTLQSTGELVRTLKF